MCQADGGAERRWGEQDSEDLVGHGRDNEVRGLADGSHLPPSWGDYNLPPCRYPGLGVGWMGAKEGCWLTAVILGPI